MDGVGGSGVRNGVRSPATSVPRVPGMWELSKVARAHRIRRHDVTLEALADLEVLRLPVLVHPDEVPGPAGGRARQRSAVRRAPRRGPPTMVAGQAQPW